MATIYLSRNPEQSADVIQALETKGHIVHACSQIKREIIRTELPPLHWDWAFFSSPFAVEAFLANHQLPAGIQTAAIGPGTAEALNRIEPCAFIGEGIDTSAIAQSFAQLVKTQSVLFPVPEKGLRKVQQELNPAQVTEVVCYRSLPNPQVVTRCDCYIFSSPSNVDSFAGINEFPEDAKYVAFGKSTASALNRKGIGQLTLLPGFKDEDLIQAIFSMFAS